MQSLADFALSMSRPAPEAPRPQQIRPADRASRHKAGDHGLCDPQSPRHGCCSECGKTIQIAPSSAPPDRRRCRECQRARPRRSAPKLLPPQVCELCEESYVPKYRPRRDRPHGQRWCSRSCKTAWQNGARPPYSRRVVAGMAWKTVASRKRRQRRAETWDGVTDAQIMERDRWRCGICRKRIGRTFRYPHPRSRSIDHIVPLSEGGDDTAANKRAAHLRCNQARGNQGGYEQVALFG